jgi:hypothetical protein
LVSVTVDVPVAVQAFVADVPVTSPNVVLTEMFAVLFEFNDVVHVAVEMLVTVIVDDPRVVNPVAVNVPEPAVPTVSVAVSPVCDGLDVL